MAALGPKRFVREAADIRSFLFVTNMEGTGMSISRFRLPFSFSFLIVSCSPLPSPRLYFEKLHRLIMSELTEFLQTVRSSSRTAKQLTPRMTKQLRELVKAADHSQVEIQRSEILCRVQEQHMNHLRELEEKAQSLSIQGASIKLVRPENWGMRGLVERLMMGPVHRRAGETAPEGAAAGREEPAGHHPQDSSRTRVGKK